MKNAITHCWIFFAIAMLANIPARADEAKPTPTPLVFANDRVLIFGDSISTGKGYGFLAVSMLNADRPELHLTWIDEGHPFWTALRAVTQLDALLAKKPNLVTIMFGTNDLGSGGARGVVELKGRIRALAEPLLKAGVRVVLLTPPAMSDATPCGKEINRSSLPQMGEEILALGKEMHVPVFDMFTFMRQADKDGQARDPKIQMFGTPGEIHPNAVGHRLMARALADFLLGQSTVKHTPFVWKYRALPQASAVYSEKPADVNALPGIKPMVVNKPEQIDEPERWKGPADLSAVAYAAWDHTALYLTVDVTENVIMAGEKQPAWLYDGVELFLDTRPREKRGVAYTPGYLQLLVAVPVTDGPAPVACGNMDKIETSAVTATCTRGNGKYRLQIAIPWAQLHFTPQKHADIGFDFALNHKDSADKPRYKALWRGQGDDYLNAGGTGVLRFE